jgi:hypothetical protein
MFKIKRKEQALEFNKITDFSPYKGYYCIIRREGVNLGLFSHYLTNAANIAACIEMGLIPIIDMQNVGNVWNHGNKIDSNPWEYYFKQPMDVGLSQVDMEKVIYQNDIVPELQRPCDSMEFLTNDVVVEYWRGFIKKYIRFSCATEKYLNAAYSSKIGNNRALGVLCRGTDYVSLKPYEHPIQPEVSEMISKTKKIFELYKYDKIYLASEDLEICRKFKVAFGDNLIVSLGEKIDNSKDNYLNKVYEERGIDIYVNTLEYLSTIYNLSRCDALIAGRTSGSVAAYLMSDGYEYSFFYNTGRYRLSNYMPCRRL